jgi:hypothetical protein
MALRKKQETMVTEIGRIPSWFSCRPWDGFLFAGDSGNFRVPKGGQE